jgi:hypothetical protein
MEIPTAHWLSHLILGAALLTLCIFIHVFGLIAISRIAFHEEVSRRREQSILFATSTFALTALAATSLFFIQALLWSGLYLHFGALNSIEHAVSFSLGVFTTYGNSGIVLGRPWVLLSEIQAVNGVMAFGITTAFLFTLAKRLQSRN